MSYPTLIAILMYFLVLALVLLFGLFFYMFYRLLREEKDPHNSEKIEGVRYAAHFIRNYFPEENCICDPERFGVTGPLPGCIFHLALELAEELECEADDLEEGKA